MVGSVGDEMESDALSTSVVIGESSVTKLSDGKSDSARSGDVSSTGGKGPMGRSAGS